MSEQNCSNCRFARVPDKQDGARDGTLLCCRRSPSPMTGAKKSGENASAWFPIVSPREWCGEYEPKEPETIADAAVTIARLVILGDRTAAYALVDKLNETREDT